MLLLRQAAALCRRTEAALRRSYSSYNTSIHSSSTSYSTSTSTSTSYSQGQSPEPRIREYFYYLDHQGQLFLDDTKVKNFVTCFKDKHFLVFFFSRLRVNESGRYQDDFPFLSLCGRERNFLRCDDRPVVFTHLLPDEPPLLSFCGGGEKLSEPFRPAALYMQPASGRLYHPSSGRVGGAGLLRSALAIELSNFFVYADGEDGQAGRPTHFLWAGRQHTLTNELAETFAAEKEGGAKALQVDSGRK